MVVPGLEAHHHLLPVLLVAHLEQLRRKRLTKMSLDQYRDNEIEAYKVALEILEQALNDNGCD